MKKKDLLKFHFLHSAVLETFRLYQETLPLWDAHANSIITAFSVGLT